MADANVASRMSQVAVQLYKVTQLPHNCVSRTHYSYTLKQADRAGAITLNEEGLVTSLLVENLKFDLPKGVELEDVLSAPLMKEVEEKKKAEKK